MTRRRSLAALAAGLVPTACVPAPLRELGGAVAAVIRPAPLPQDRAAVFHGLVPGQPASAISSFRR